MNSAFYLSVLAGTVVAVFVIMIGLLIFQHDTPDGPQQVFEAHLLALDEGRLDDALSYIDTSSCGTIAVDGAEEARAGLKQLGHTFSTAFRVEGVWTLEDGDATLLVIESPANVPLVTVPLLHKVDGEWRIACE